MSEQQNSEQSGKPSAGFFARHKASLLAGAMALGLAGALTVQGLVPSNYAFAAPVEVSQPAPLNFSNVVSAGRGQRQGEAGRPAAHDEFPWRRRLLWPAGDG